jgi:hypothetical protein
VSSRLSETLISEAKGSPKTQKRKIWKINDINILIKINENISL